MSLSLNIESDYRETEKRSRECEGQYVRKGDYTTSVQISTVP